MTTIRTLTNVPGINYDEEKTHIFFAEDYNNLAEKVANIEEEVENMEGGGGGGGGGGGAGDPFLVSEIFGGSRINYEDTNPVTIHESEEMELEVGQVIFLESYAFVHNNTANSQTLNIRVHVGTYELNMQSPSLNNNGQRGLVWVKAFIKVVSTSEFIIMSDNTLTPLSTNNAAQNKTFRTGCTILGVNITTSPVTIRTTLAKNNYGSGYIIDPLRFILKSN